MKLLTRCSNLVEAHHWANLLRAAGIRTEVRNTWLSGAVGDIPQRETWPQLWIPDPQDESAAMAVIHGADRDIGKLPVWRCADCGELLEGQFAQCWNCGADRPDPRGPEQ